MWWRSGVVYEVYPRSFQDTDGDGVGDLRGVADRLPYLARLGIDAIWLTPFYASPMRDFGYDISDHRAIDPSFGTMDDFDALVAAAHDLGIKVLLDFVPNHTSDLHPWFQESRASRASAKRDWYIWRDGDPPNTAIQLLGGFPSRQRYQSRFVLSRDERDSTNHGCRSEVWFGTKSSTTLMPCSCAAATSASKSSSVPNEGSTAQWSVMS